MRRWLIALLIVAVLGVAGDLVRLSGFEVRRCHRFGWGFSIPRRAR